MADIEILGSPFSNYVRSVRMALEEKGVSYSVTPCAPHVPEVMAIHPLGKIPCLRHGDFTLCESAAIARYIDRSFAGPKLFPEEPKTAALAEQWTSMINTALIPAFQGYFVGYFFRTLPDGTPNRPMIEAAAPAVENHLRLLDRVLTGKSFLAGDSFTYADMDILPVLAYARQLPESGAVYRDSPALNAYFDRHAQRASFIATEPPSIEELKIISRQMAAEQLAKTG
jgi:Glutathione S-transferase